MVRQIFRLFWVPAVFIGYGSIAVGIGLPETSAITPLWGWVITSTGILAFVIALVLIIKNRRIFYAEQETYVEIRLILYKMHSELSNMAEQVAKNIKAKNMRNAYTNFIKLYQSKGKMQNIKQGKNKDIRKMSEKAFKSLKLKSVNDAEALSFVLNMAWSIRDQDIILVSPTTENEYDKLNDLLEKLRAKAPKLNTKIDICLKYSFGLNNWYLVNLYAYRQKEKLPRDIRIGLVGFKQQIDEFMHALIAKVGG